MALEQKDNVIKFPDFVENFNLGNWYDLQRQQTEMLRQQEEIRKQRDGV
tara:strand:+ start:339 stop:485 length:147 start_codon:yes stop_codon:yes gene_type:complete